MFKNKTLFALFLGTTLLLSACSSGQTPSENNSAPPETTISTDAQKESSPTSSSDTAETPPVSETASESESVEGAGSSSPQIQESESTSPQSQESISSEAAQTTGTLYIGSGESFSEYPFTAEKTPDNLIHAISDLTGWDLSLADSVTDGKGGMTVCFTKDCSIFTGPPAQQHQDFFAYDNITLTQMILDSITKTLQENYVDRDLGGDPSTLNIYFCVMEDGNLTSITLPDGGITIPMDQPYQGLTIE